MTTVQSADGTTIAYEHTGHGPALILVGGALNDRTGRASGTPLAALLAARFTVYSYDRRGRGDSSDTPPYAIDREVEDLAALFDTTGPAFVYGMSSGAILALEAALAGLAITKLALYEPPIGRRDVPSDFADQLAGLCARDRCGDAVELFLTTIGTPPAIVAQMRHAPLWTALERLAPTLAYDAALTAIGPSLRDRAAKLATPVCVMAGGASSPWLRDAARALAGAVPAGRHITLDGQTHDVAPAVLAPALVDCLG
jgi:pimeloyl-ACP methyl ester carboxylesterase